MLCHLFWMNVVHAASQLIYASPMGEEKWRMDGNPLRCGLSIVIPEYGIGYFEQYATQSPHFILRNWEETKKVVSAQVMAESPVWKPGGPQFLITKTAFRPGDYGLFLSRDPSLKLLSYLSKGLKAHIKYRSEQGFDVSVMISPIHFHSVYVRFQRCVGSLLPFNYAQVRETVLHFGVDSHELTDGDKIQLRRIAKYVDADEQIEKIRIVGYTDDTGRKGYNNAVSQDRAEEVQHYLIKLGISKDMISMNWFGSQKPIAPNNTDAGRAANRRVVIELIKK